VNDKGVKLEEYIDQRRWLMNNGLIHDDVKNQLFFCGSIVHKNVQAVELDIETDKKLINYTIYVDKELLALISRYKTLSNKDGLFDLWRLKNMLKKHGSLNFQAILNKFVRDFCGPNWASTVKVVDIVTYIEGIEEHGVETINTSQLPNRQSD